MIAALTPSDSDAATIWADRSARAARSTVASVGSPITTGMSRSVAVAMPGDDGIGLDRHDLSARLDEGGGQPDAHRAEAAHDRVVSGTAGAEPGELLAEHDARRLQQGAGGDDRGDEAGDLQSPVDRFGVALVAERGELQREVQIVEERRRRAEVVRLLDEPADAEHEQQRSRAARAATIVGVASGASSCGARPGHRDVDHRSTSLTRRPDDLGRAAAPARRFAVPQCEQHVASLHNAKSRPARRRILASRPSSGPVTSTSSARLEQLVELAS